MLGIRDGNLWVPGDSISADQDLRRGGQQFVGGYSADKGTQSDIGMFGRPVRDTDGMARGDGEAGMFPYVTVFSAENNGGRGGVEDGGMRRRWGKEGAKEHTPQHYTATRSHMGGKEAHSAFTSGGRRTALRYVRAGDDIYNLSLHDHPTHLYEREREID